MQQYIYGNIGHLGYRYESSEPRFFKDANHAAVLTHLVTYDPYCVHEGLSVEEHQSYWMVTTDLDQYNEPERLYLQASGGETFRNGYYAQGYVSDPEDGELYGPRFLKLLRTRFDTLPETMARAQRGNLEGLKPEALPMDEHLKPARLDSLLLQNILLGLLQGKRVIVRLPSTGRQAMQDSRELLLAVYERLPYEQRRTKGFFTGGSAAKLYDYDNPLPAVVFLILMDGDADVEGVESDMDQLFLDLAAPGGKLPAMPWEKNQKLLPQKALIDFLAEQPPEVLDQYFRLCQSYVKEGLNAADLKLEDYRMLMEFFSIGRTEFTDDAIALWAESLQSSKWPVSLRTSLYEKLAQALNPKALEAYLLKFAHSYESLNTLGLRDHGAEEGKDVNGARAFKMTEALLGYYPAEAWRNLLFALRSRYVELARTDYSCLAAMKPTAATQRDLDQVPLPRRSDTDLPLIKDLKTQVIEAVEGMRKSVRSVYEGQLDRQRKQGSKLIQDFPFQSKGSQGLEALYQRLQSENYLYEELLSQWNPQIAQKAAELSAKSSPQTLEDYRELLELTRDNRKSFQAHGGQFTPDQLQQLDSGEAKWSHVLKLSERECKTLSDLLDLYEQINREALNAPLEQQLKMKYTLALRHRKPDARQFLEAKDRLCRHAEDRNQRELLKILLASAGLETVGKDLDAAKILTRLEAVKQLAEAGLLEDTVNFQPLGVKERSGQLLRQIGQLQDYRKGSPEPSLDSRKVRQWALDQFGENTDLMLLLVRRAPELRGQLIKLLARKPGGVTPEDISQMYIYGCSRKQLTEGAGNETAVSWKQAVESLTPKWPQLPGPLVNLPRKNVQNRALILIETILLALAGIVPAAGLFLGAAGSLAWLVLAGVLAGTAAGCAVAGAVVKVKQRKTILLAMALALLPGLVATIAGMILM